MPVKVLHLSDTTISGAPFRIHSLFKNNRALGYVSRHIVWHPTTGFRVFPTDMVGSEMEEKDLKFWLDWADIIHYHNRYARQEIFQKLGTPPPDKPSVIQMHSPRHEDENFEAEAASGVPLAVVAQYHPREWPEASFLVPNVVDIEEIRPHKRPPLRRVPVVSYAPSNHNGKGWNDKGYAFTAPILKKMQLRGLIKYAPVIKRPYELMMQLKSGADIGIDEVATGSYHLSSLEYMALGVPCICRLDEKTQEVVRNLTGCDWLPWVDANEHSLERILRDIIQKQQWPGLGARSRRWMEQYWSPEVLLNHYIEMYEEIRK